MRNARLAIGLIVVASVLRLALAAFIPLLPDETYYWDWSRHLAAGYFDHPPAVALLIHFGTTVFGYTPLGVRLGAVLAGAVASIAVVVMSWRLNSDADAVADNDYAGATSALGDPGVRAALLMLVIPGALVGFVLATPDAPLLAAIALTLAALERAIASPPRSTASLGWWCAAGVMLGVAFCSKFTSVLIPAGVFVALLSRQALRARLAEPGPYLATLLALAVLTPTLIWNSHNGWISFVFQLHHGFTQARGSILSREAGLVAGQLGIISPIIAVLAAIAVARCLRRVADDRRFMLAVIATTVAAFFVVSAIRRPVEPNWPVPALVAALPLLATMRLGRVARTWLLAGSALGAACTLVVTAQAAARVFPMQPRRDPIAKAYGWPDLARAVRDAKTASGNCSATLIAADRYQDASELAFNLPDHPRVFSLNLGGRANQYDLWPSIYSAASHTDCAIVAVDEGAGGENVVRRIGADSAALIGHAEMKWRGVVVGRRAIWIVRGIPETRPVEVALTPGASAALSKAASTFASHKPILDSIVAVYRLAPGPDAVTPDSATPIVSKDRRVAISARVNSLHDLLQRGGFRSVYRDARYHECTFVSASKPDSTDVGYVYAPEGCKLAVGRGDRVLRIEHAEGSWYSYASPERRPAEISPDPDRGTAY